MKLSPNAEHGKHQEFRIIDALRRQMMTDIDVAALLGISRKGALIYLARLRVANRIHIGAHQASPAGRPRPLYRAGKGTDAVYVPKKVRKDKQPDRRETAKALILALLEKPHTTSQIAERIHRAQSVVRRYVSELRAEGLVCIWKWKHPGKQGDWAPMYRQGQRKDAKKPGKESRASRWQKEKNSPERHERLLQKRRTYDRVVSARSKPQGVFSALGL